MWTKENCARYDRSALRYPSDLTDTEWAILAPLIPPAKHGGRPARGRHSRGDRRVALCLGDGLSVETLAKDFPPKSTVHRYVELWAWDGTLARIHNARYVAVREREGREASPSAAILDSQSAKSARKGGPSIDPVGFDGGKKIKGIKRHILTDRHGLLLASAVHAASIQDRDGAALVLTKALRRRLPFIATNFADAATRDRGSATPRNAPAARTSTSSSAPIAWAASLSRPSGGCRAHPCLDQSKSPACPRLRKPRHHC